MRRDGTRTFPASRITLPECARDDGPEGYSVFGLSNRKNTLVLDLIVVEGVSIFAESVRYVEAVCEAGLPRAVVTCCANAEQVLAETDLGALCDVRVDARVVAARDIAGNQRPTPTAPRRGCSGGAGQAVFEASQAGVRADRAGGVALVVGVDQDGQGEQLRTGGTDVVVTELSDLMAES